MFELLAGLSKFVWLFEILKRIKMAWGVFWENTCQSPATTNGGFLRIAGNFHEAENHEHGYFSIFQKVQI